MHVSANTVKSISGWGARLDYVFQFGTVWREWPLLLDGLMLTIRLSVLAMTFGVMVATVGAFGASYGPRWVRALIFIYVEIIRNTPFLVQLLVIYLGLPAVGLRLDANQAAIVAMTVNVGAYGTEIIRAGIDAVPKGQIEAGLALGLNRLLIFRFIILRQALIATFPALSSQFILLMLGTSVVSAIAAEELTATANTIQARTFRAFEIYFVVTGIYLGLSLLFRAVFRVIYRSWIQAQ
jgi:polar amino acid transport system permease protein